MRAALSAGLVALLAACSAGDPPTTTPDGSETGGAAASGGGGNRSGSGGTSGSSAGGKGNAGSSGSSGDTGATGGTDVIGGTACPEAKSGRPTLRLLTQNEFENTINDIFPGIQGAWTDSLTSDVVSEFGFDNDSAAVVGGQRAEAILDTALSIGAAVTGSALQNLLPCASAAADRACADSFVDQYGRRLFRRPVTPAEKERYLGLFDTGLAAADFPTALKWVVAGLIQSPNALYRSEIGALAGGKRTLDAYELVTELAYTFGGTTPSAADLDRAEAGQMPDLAAVAKDLLATPKGQEVVHHFFASYLGYSQVAAVSRNVPPSDDNPNVVDFGPIGKAMVQETRAFIADVVLNQRGGVAELLTADTTNPSQALADFYGFPRPASDNASITRPAGRGIGILAQGSFLASHANGDASSPTLRGLFPYYRLLCQPKLTPPKNVPMISSAPETNTTRERYEVAHMTQGSACRGCHQFFDPIGFGFEEFDQAGRFRSTQNGEDVNPADVVTDPDGNELFSFTNQEELARGFAALPESFECFSAYLATYAFGSADACLGLDSTQIETMQEGLGIVDAYATLASEPHFVERSAE
jgi:hypothetical protein